MPASSIHAVLFDLDGTLVDTAGDLVAAVNRLLLQRGRSPVSLTALRPYVSQGGLRLICEAFGIETSSRFALELREEYLELYRANLSCHSRLFPGMEEFLLSLENAEIPWGIVTNKPEWLTFPLIEEMGLNRRTSCIVGGDTLAESKPSPAPVLHACEILGISAKHVLMIGDDKRDIDSGSAAGTETIAAAWGYILPQDDLHLWGANHSFETVAQLHAWFH